MVIQVITVTIDCIDSEQKETKVVRSQEPVKETDHGFLSYLFGVDTAESERVTIEIVPLDDAIDQASPDGAAELLFIERHDGVFHVHMESLPMDKVSSETLNELLRTPAKFRGCPYRFSLYDGDVRNGNFALMLDVGKHKAIFNPRASLTKISCLQGYTGQCIVIPQRCYINTDGIAVEMTFAYLPEKQRVLVVEWCDGNERTWVFDLQGNVVPTI